MLEWRAFNFLSFLEFQHVVRLKFCVITQQEYNSLNCSQLTLTLSSVVSIPPTLVKEVLQLH